jgi:hypothetical protein
VYNGTVQQIFIDFRQAYDSGRSLVLYIILSDFRISRKLVGLIKMCLNETFSAVCISQNLSEKNSQCL